VRSHIHALIALALLVAAAPVFAASKQDHADCDSDDVDRNLTGCTRILEDTSESNVVRSIAYVNRAMAYGAKGDADHEMSDFSEAIKLNPQDALAYNDRAIAWREQHDIDKAIADFTEAIRLNPQPRSDLTGPGHVNVYANRGMAWQAKGDLDQALSDYNQSLKLDADDPETYFYRAQIFVSKHDFDSAIGDLDQVVQRVPNDSTTRYLRGALRYDRYMYAGGMIEQSDFDGAIDDFSQAIKLDPTDVRPYQARAEAYDVDSKPDLAIADLMSVIKIDPSNRDAIALLKQLKPDFTPPDDPLAKLNWSPPGSKP
jgi:tetratricopeptide (TPR) repeat protein